MLGLPLLGGGPGQRAPGVDELVGVQGPPAIFALISPCPVVSAVGTSALHVAIGEETLPIRVEELEARAGDDVTRRPQLAEDVPGDLAMVVGEGGREQVEGDAEIPPVAKDLRVITGDDLRRADPLLVCFDGDGSAVGIATGDHQYPIAGQAVISSENVGGQVGAGQVTQV